MAMLNNQRVTKILQISFNIPQMKFTIDIPSRFHSELLSNQILDHNSYEPVCFHFEYLRSLLLDGTHMEMA